MSNPNSFELYKGATRLPTIFGIPRMPAILVGCASGALFLFIKFYALPVIVIALMICFIVTRYDDRAFRIVGLWIQTKFRNTRNSKATQLWQASSYSPMRYRRKL